MVNVYNLLAQLRNGYNAHKSVIYVKSSKESLELLFILKNYGLIRGISPISNNQLKIFLKYTGKTKALLNIGSVSKPSLPVYYSLKDLWKFHKSYGILVVETSYGLICHHTALKKKLGGKLVCYVL